MVRLIAGILLSALIISCDTNDSEKSGSTEAASENAISPEMKSTAGQVEKEESLENEEGHESQRCDVFLKDYDSWSDEFLSAAKSMMKNPNSEANREAYMNTASKMSKWAGEWESLQDCVENPKYRKQFEDITAYMQSEMAKIKDS